MLKRKSNQQANKKSHKVRNTILSIIAVISVISLCSAEPSDKQSESTDKQSVTQEVQEVEEVQPKITYIPIGTLELHSALDSNAMKAEQTFKGQYLRVKGYVYNIDNKGSYFTLSYKDEFNLDWSVIQVNVPKELRSKVADLQKGSIIEVNVKVTSVGEIMGYSAELQNWE